IMTDIEIPHKEERSKRYRFFEMLPGFLSWGLLALPVVLSYINATLAAFFILAYLITYFVRAVGVSIRALQGHKVVRQAMGMPWRTMVDEIQQLDVPDTGVSRPKWHFNNIARLRSNKPVVKPDDLIHVAMIATYNESREVLEPTIQSV